MIRVELAVAAIALIATVAVGLRLSLRACHFA
jgi:hypothetical protein